MKWQVSVKKYHKAAAYECDRLIGYGTFFYPHIVIGSENRRENDGAERSADTKVGFEVVFDVSFQEWRAIVYENGFAVITFGRQCTRDGKTSESFTDSISWQDEKLERSKAGETLNIIFALSALRCHATTSLALIKVAVDSESGKILDCVAYVSSLRDLPLLESVSELEAEQVEAKSIKAAVQNAAELSTERAKEETNKKGKSKKKGKVALYCDRLSILLQAETHHDNNEFAQSFILSWIVMEHYISQQWEELLAAEGAEDKRARKTVKDRFDKLRNFSIYPTDTKLEVLKLTGKLSLEQYDLLMAFKRVRNDITHAGRVVTSEQSANILFVARLLVGKGLDLVSAHKISMKVTDSEGKLVKTWDFPDVPFIRFGIDVDQSIG
jgi:hypothetical protein